MLLSQGLIFSTLHRTENNWIKTFFFVIYTFVKKVRYYSVGQFQLLFDLARLVTYNSCLIVVDHAWNISVEWNESANWCKTLQLILPEHNDVRCSTSNVGSITQNVKKGKKHLSVSNTLAYSLHLELNFVRVSTCASSFSPSKLEELNFLLSD
jgi:hypothetical protein